MLKCSGNRGSWIIETYLLSAITSTGHDRVEEVIANRVLKLKLQENAEEPLQKKIILNSNGRPAAFYVSKKSTKQSQIDVNTLKKIKVSANLSGRQTKIITQVNSENPLENYL